MTHSNIDHGSCASEMISVRLSDARSKVNNEGDMTTMYMVILIFFVARVGQSLPRSGGEKNGKNKDMG